MSAAASAYKAIPTTRRETLNLARNVTASSLYGLTFSEAARRLVAARAFGVSEAAALRMNGCEWWQAACEWWQAAKEIVK